MGWITDVKGNGRADVLALFLLCKLTNKHCMVHLSGNRYWSTLKEEPDTHEEFLLRCDLYLAYVGKGIYAQLILWTESLEYAIFGIMESGEPTGVEKKPLVVGTLTADEDKTLSYLLNMGISQNISQTETYRHSSASAGSKRELPRVECELRLSTRPKTEMADLLILTEQVPVLKVKGMSYKDIEVARENLKKRSKTWKNK